MRFWISVAPAPPPPQPPAATRGTRTPTPAAPARPRARTLSLGRAMLVCILRSVGIRLHLLLEIWDLVGIQKYIAGSDSLCQVVITSCSSAVAVLQFSSCSSGVAAQQLPNCADVIAVRRLRVSNCGSEVTQHLQVSSVGVQQLPSCAAANRTSDCRSAVLRLSKSLQVNTRVHASLRQPSCPVAVASPQLHINNCQMRNCNCGPAISAQQL